MTQGKLGVIGVGHLIEHLLPGLVDGGVAPGDIVLSPRNRDTSARLRDSLGVNVAPDNQSVIDACGTILLSVRPAHVDDVLADLDWRAGQHLVSLCAGVPMERLRARAPGVTVVRAMPVTAGKYGASPTCIFPDDPVVRHLFTRIGSVVPMDTQDMFERCAPAAAYYVWVQELVRVFTAKLSEDGAPPVVARALVAGMTTAAGRIAAEEEDVDLKTLVSSYCLPGSLSGAGLDVLGEHDAFEGWRAAYDKVRAIAENRDASSAATSLPESD